MDSGSVQMDSSVQYAEERLVSEEFRTWKKNSPFLYDFLLTSAVEWPTLAVTWLDHLQQNDKSQTRSYRLAIGTHTNGDEENLLKILELRVPHYDNSIPLKNYESTTEFKPNQNTNTNVPRIELLSKIRHLGEVNRILPHPNNPFLLATKCPTGDVLVFNYSTHPANPLPREMCKPLIRLAGISDADSFSLDWSSTNLGHVAAAGTCTIAIWDVNQTPFTPESANKSDNKNSTAAESKQSADDTDASAIFKANLHAVEMGPTLKPIWTHPGLCKPSNPDEPVGNIDDLQFHKHAEHTLGLVSDEGGLYILDTRQSPDNCIVSHVEKAHEEGASSLAFNPYNEYLVATGGVDGLICLWDTRKLGEKLHSMDSHGDAVSRMQFAPFAEPILASGGDDGRVCVWDLSRIGAEQVARDVLDGPPELLFVHGGHTSRVSDLSWNPLVGGEWMIASCSEDNQLMIWKPNEEIIYDEDFEALYANVDSNRRSNA